MSSYDEKTSVTKQNLLGILVLSKEVRRKASEKVLLLFVAVTNIVIHRKNSIC